MPDINALIGVFGTFVVDDILSSVVVLPVNIIIGMIAAASVIIVTINVVVQVFISLLLILLPGNIKNTNNTMLILIIMYLLIEY